MRELQAHSVPTWLCLTPPVPPEEDYTFNLQKAKRKLPVILELILQEPQRCELPVLVV